MKHEQQPPTAAPQAAHNQEQSRYELRVDGEVAAVAEYRDEDGAVRFTHTQVEPRYEGQGLGSQLAAFALDDVRTQGKKALPQCRFIAQYIARHEKEYGDLVVR